jgi:hypothetical protein
MLPYIDPPRVKMTNIHEIIKKGDRVVVYEYGKHYTYYGEITDENSEMVKLKTSLILEGIK